MKVAGVIAEYNPFHNGHKYQLDQIRSQSDADYIITAISGSFMQRGEPAIISKYQRTQMALANGADLVIELPIVGACSSAEYFAKTGINILRSTGIVDYLYYGVEDDNRELFTKIVSVFSDDTRLSILQNIINEKLREGLSYPLAREKALCQILASKVNAEQLSSFLALPNNILAIEYEKAIHEQFYFDSDHPELTSRPLLRVGSAYHDASITNHLASATGIRRLLSSYLAEGDKKMLCQLQRICPAITYKLLLEDSSKIVLPNQLSQALYYKLLLYKNAGYMHFADCNEELSNKIANNLYKYDNFEQFSLLLKSKNLTLARIRRALIHILLEIKQEDYCVLRDQFYSPYIRVLGFRRNSSALLHAMKKKASAPIITKVADASRILSSDANYLLQKDLFASDFYNILNNSSSKYNEFTKGLIIM